jgi:multidrug efflux pump subunit AcrA (membrane-fusion protein)
MTASPRTTRKTAAPDEAAGAPATFAGPPAGLPTAAVEPGLDRPVRLIGGRLSLAAAALVLAVGAGTAWAVAGSLPHTLVLHGVLAHGPAPVTVSASAPGSVVRVLVAPGAHVVKGQPLAVLADSRSRPADPGSRTEITAPDAGIVTAVLTAAGGTVVPGSGVIALDPASAPATVRLFSADAGRLRRLQAGQQVVVGLPGGTTVRLRITGADPYPATADTLRGTLPVPVPGVPTGTVPVWTVNTVPDRPQDAAALSGAMPTAVDASVDLGARHPYQVLFGSTGAGS